MNKMSQYWNQTRVDELEKVRLEKERLAKKTIPSAFQTGKKVSNLKQEKNVISVNSFNQGLTPNQISEVQKIANEEGFNLASADINAIYYKMMNDYSTLQNAKQNSYDHVVGSQVIAGTVGEINSAIENSWDNVIDLTSQKTESQAKKFQESTPLEKLIPIIVEPVKMPNISFLRCLLGPTKTFEKQWLITRTFEEFTTLIVELFGKVDKPTKIPVAISFAYFLDLDKKEFDIKTEVKSYDDDEQFIIREELVGSSNKYYDKTYFDSVKSITDRVISKKKKHVSAKNEITGLDCAKWLIENNYVPEYVIIHEKKYYNYYENEIGSLLTDWQDKNNVIPQQGMYGSIVD